MCQSWEQFAKYTTALLRAEICRTWNLEDQYPFRFQLLRFSEDAHAFLVSFSHLVMDGRGISLFSAELWRAYEKRLADTGLTPAVNETHATPSRKQPEAISNDATAAFWRTRAKTMPPAFQFDLKQGPTDGDGAPELAVLRLQEEEQAELLISVKRARCSPFQWFLAAFAATLFDITAQDYLSITLPFDLRNPAERNAIGMFMLSLPIRLTRDTATPGGLLRQVRREVMTVLSHRFVAPDILDEAYAASVARWGAPWVTEIRAVNVEHWDQSRREVQIGSMVAREGLFSPRLQYTSGGVDCLVGTGGGFTELNLCFSAARFSAADATSFTQTLRRRLADGDSYVCPRAAAESLAGRGLVPLHDSEGRIVMWSDINATRGIIQRHPSVTSVEIGIERDADGGDRLSAAITVSEHIDEEALRCQLLAAASSRYALVPEKFSISAHDSMETK